MVDIQYIGELLWPKHLGQLLLLLSFFSTALAAYAYYQSSKRNDNSWKRLGNQAFSVHGVSMLIVIGLIFYLMINKHYEYTYAQAHVSDDLPMKYIFSAFWEGQEGSFMLWMFWHIILAWVIMVKNSRWVAPTLFFLSLIQLFILSMIQGIHFSAGDWIYKLGSNPLSLLRETMDIPLFANAEYVSLLQGTGLNPLLQNYWMTIHPPVLFLGFASVSIPFCYALGSLLVREYREWLKPALKWALFSSSIFGIGILMGAAWAYEALTFGGYWAWDPVENTSLVPWITLVAGVHTNLIARNTKYSVRSTYWFYMISLLLVVYSTTLTRSGILGDSSVHAFTEIGLESQLAAFNFFLIAIGLYFYFSRVRSIKSPKEEESAGSREFWMFIGSLVLLFSAIMITASSSLPVFNKIYQLFDPEFTSMVLEDPISHYNKYQLWIGVLVGILSAVTIFFRYNERNAKRIWKKPIRHIAISAAIAIVLHFVANMWLELKGFQFHLLLFSALFTIVSNIEHLVAFAKINFKSFSSVISHVGFGLMIIGVLASGLNKRNISNNEFMAMGLLDESRIRKNIPLIKGKPMYMNGYWVEYERDTVLGQNRYFDINFKKIDDQEKVTHEFTVRPNVLYSNDLTKVASTNPDTKHYFHKDIFTAIDALPTAQQDIKFAKEMEDTLDYVLVEIPLGEELEHDGYRIKVKEIIKEASHIDYQPEVGDIPIQASVEIIDSLGKSYNVTPATVLRSSVVYKYHTQVDDLHSRFRLNERSFDNIIKPDQALEYQEIKLKAGEDISLDGYKLSFLGFKKPEEGEIDFAQKDDISVKANIQVQTPDSGMKILSPTFIIRDKQFIPIRDSWWEEGIYARLDYIEPSTGEATISFCKDKNSSNLISLEIANNVPRQDFIAIQVLEFPGINLVWLGCIAMMFGLGLGLINRIVGKWA